MATLGQIFAPLVVIFSVLLAYGAAKPPDSGQPYMLVCSLFAVFMTISALIIWECCLYPAFYSPLRDLPKPPVGSRP
jgi:hypothetical protein